MKGRERFLLTAIFLLLSANYAGAGTWETLQVPGAITNGSQATGVDGGNVVGWYRDVSGNDHGFLYDGSSWESLDVPYPTWTVAYGISGSNIVGACGAGGFLYNGTNYQILDIPGSTKYAKYATDIDGSNIIGNYGDDSGQQHGFLYNGSSWSTIDPAGSTMTFLNGISGNNIVGQYSHPGGASGFIYNISSGTTTDLGGLGYLHVLGIDGDNIVGIGPAGPHTVLYNMTNGEGTILAMPGATGTYASAISGDKIVGDYVDASYIYRPFIYTIPEPASCIIMGIGAAFMSLRRRYR